MNRMTGYLSILVLFLSLALVSCEQMYTTNLFGSLTHPKPSVSAMQKKSPDQIKEYISSTANLNQLIDDPDLKAAALTALGYGSGQTVPTTAVTADQQTAAIVAAEIAIKTVPVASGFSAAVLGTLASGSELSTETTADVVSLVESVLPDEIASSLQAGSTTPPDSFIQMINAYADANAAYEALGTGVASNAGSYAEGLSISSSETKDIAVNAVIAGMINAVTPVGITNPTSADVAVALWSALNNNAAAETYVTVSSTTLDTLTSGTGPIACLVTASGLGSLLEGGN
jgi:hypothetical protein